MDESRATATTSSAAVPPAEQPEASVSLAPRGGRDPWLDNTRLLAAVLIVVMHVAGQAMSRSGVLYELWFATWPLRVPLFVLVAGFFSSAEPLRGRRAVGILRNILGVYLVADLIASAVSWLSGSAFDYNPASPPFAVWFLLSLFWWRSLLPLLAHVRFIGPISVVAALGVGFVPSIGHSFSASRTIAYLPLFLLGWYLRRVDVRSLVDRSGVRPVAWAVLAVVLGLGATFGADVKRRAYTLRDGYPGERIVEQLPHAGVRGVVLAFGVVGALALLAVMPRRRLPVLTYLGTGSMYIYVIHALVMGQSSVRQTEWYLAIDSLGEMVLLIAAAVLFALALASPPVRWLTRWFIQPRYRWLFRDEAPSTPPLGGARAEVRSP